MGTITLTNPVAGTEIQAGPLATNFTNLQSLLNGGLDNSNISASALLDATARIGVRKNSGGSVFSRRRLNLIEGSNITLTVADDSGSEEVDITIAGTGGATTATTIAGLGTASDGKIGLLRIGSTPYEFIYLIYDGTLAKWVSPAYPVPLCTMSNATSADYNTVPAGTFLGDYKAIYDAGLRLQARSGSRWTQNWTTSVRVSEFTNADTALVSLGTTQINSGSANQYVNGAWTTYTGSAPTEAQALLLPSFTVSTNAGNSPGDAMQYRWVSS